MSGIEELRDRVTDAEKRFGSNDAERAGYSERLVAMMNAVEGRIREQQDEIAQQAATIEKHDIEAAAQQAKIDGQRTAIDQHAGEIEKLKTAGVGTGEENEELRDMLHALLQTIESSGRDGLAEAMQELDRKASALVDAVAVAPVAESAAEESIERVDEAPAKAAIAVGSVSIAPLEEADEADGAEIETATIVEPALEEIAEPVTEAPGETALAATLEAGPEVVPIFTAEFAAEIAAEISDEINIEPPSEMNKLMKRVSKLAERA